uniref:Fibrinogen alpha/beta/gamma chain coiled coil domain-containing protein n=1 Tax=Catharus ustulatus TaxID=91951 RepID=A0A8C3TXV0_CATUS
AYQMAVICPTNGESTFEQVGAGSGRGPRIVEHKSQSSCQSEKSWPFCADDDWGTKCPSGCRMQGLIDEKDQEFSRRIDRIKKLLSDNQNSYKKSNQIIVETDSPSADNCFCKRRLSSCKELLSS